MSEIRLTLKQLNEIRHALGGEVKKGSYRNYFNTGDECQSWEELVSIGFATRKNMGQIGGITYFVTEKAISSLTN